MEENLNMTFEDIKVKSFSELKIISKNNKTYEF